MGSFSIYFQQKILEFEFKVASSWQPTNIYVGLCTSTPSDTTFGTEVSGGAYARVTCNTWTTASTNSPSTISNNVTLTFPTPTALWGTVSHFIISDSTNGTATTNLIAWGALSTSKTINISDTVSFAANAITVTLD